MADTYLEVIGDNGNVVIDDNFACLEVIDSFPLSQCSRQDWAGGYAKYHNYVYNFPHTIKSNAMVGISLNGLNGVPAFSFDVTQNYIRFFGNGSGINNIGIVSVDRADIIQNSTLYVFDISEKGASTSGCGLEILNSAGKVVYSSNSSYLNVIDCGSDESKDIVQIPFSSSVTVAVKLGDDNSSEYWMSHHLGQTGGEYTKRPAFKVENNTVKIGPHFLGIVFPDDFDTPTYNPSTGQWEDNYGSGDLIEYEYFFSAWLGYGWLVGNIV